MIATVMVLVIVIALVAYILLLLLVIPSTPVDGSSKPATIGMAGGVPATMACGTTAGALYYESVSITSTSGTITTSTFGLKVVPTAGGYAVKNAVPPSSGSPCPTSGGFYVSLANAAGTAVGCWSGGTGSWSTPTGGTCGNQAGSTLSSPVAIAGGQTFVVYMYGSSLVPPMAGAYTMQVYGIGGATVSGSVDL